MAHLPTISEGVTPNIIENIRTCLEDRASGGRIKRDRLAAIASKLGFEGSNKPWVGHVLALLCESLEASVINDTMTHGHGRYKKEWDKWRLGEGRPAWQNKKGEDTIRNFVYNLLIDDLIILKKGYRVDGGIQIKGLSVRGVCRKVKDDIGIVVIKDSYLREQLEHRGGARQASTSSRINTQSVGSPSTLGAPTPTSIDITSASPYDNPTSGLLPGSLNTPSCLPTPIRYAYGSGVSSRPDTATITRGPTQPQLSKSTNYHYQSRRPINKSPSQQKPPQNSTDAALLYNAEDLNPTPASRDEMFFEMDSVSHNGQLVPSSSYLMPRSSGRVGNVDSRSLAPVQAGDWSMAEKRDYTEEAGLVCNPTSSGKDISYADGPSDHYSTSFPLPLVCTAEAQFKDVFTQLFEQMKLLTRRLEATEHTARDARANEVDKWQNEYKRLGESYEELSSGYVSQQGRIDSLNQKSNYLEGLCESLKEAKINEQTKREKLADEMETLRQRYDSHDATIQRLNNSNGELHSKILSLESDNAMQTEHINNLQSSLSKLETENSDLETALGILHDSKDLLRTEVTKLQIDNNQLIGQLGKMKDEKLNIERTAEALQQQKDNLKNKVDNLQVENVELRTQVAQLQEAKANLDEKVDVLARECASFQEQSKARDIKATQESQCRLSNWTIDSGMGESIRASTSSTRKRQISITDEREEKRHRSLLFFGGDDSTFLADPDPEELRLMLTSELPIRRGSEGPPHTEDKWI